MTIVPYKTFVSLPVGTMYAEYTPCVFGKLYVKGLTINDGRDWFYSNIQDSFMDSHDTYLQFEQHCENMEKGVVTRVDFDTIERDGLFEYDRQFLIYDKTDIEQLINHLKNVVMTNTEAKQKAIQEAYGDYWERVKDHLVTDGWCEKRTGIDFKELKKTIPIEYHEFVRHCFRPISLKGIDDNNGWNRIESNLDLPAFTGLYKFIQIEDGDKTEAMFFPDSESSVFFTLKYYSHWKPIPQESLPIY